MAFIQKRTPSNTDDIQMNLSQEDDCDSSDLNGECILQDDEFEGSKPADNLKQSRQIQHLNYSNKNADKIDSADQDSQVSQRSKVSDCHSLMSIPRNVTNTIKKSKRQAESKKLVFLSNKVLEEVMQKSETTGTKIANRILEIYKDKKINMDFKNVQRRVYDALNVLSALSIIKKDRNRIKYRGSPFISGSSIDIFGKAASKNSEQHQNTELQVQKRIKEEKIKQIDMEIQQKQSKIDKSKQLLKEQVLQHLSIKKIIKRNFEINKLSGITNTQSEKDQQIGRVQLPFVGFVLMSEDPRQKILVQESKEKDVLSLYSSTQICPFTENDVFEHIGIRQTNEEELRDLVKPDHLKFVHQMFGMQTLDDLVNDNDNMDPSQDASGSLRYHTFSQNSNKPRQKSALSTLTSQPNFSQNTVTQSYGFSHQGKKLQYVDKNSNNSDLHASEQLDSISDNSKNGVANITDTEGISIKNYKEFEKFKKMNKQFNKERSQELQYQNSKVNIGYFGSSGIGKFGQNQMMKQGQFRQNITAEPPIQNNLLTKNGSNPNIDFNNFSYNCQNIQMLSPLSQQNERHQKRVEEYNSRQTENMNLQASINMYQQPVFPPVHSQPNQNNLYNFSSFQMPQQFYNNYNGQEPSNLF